MYVRPPIGSSVGNPPGSMVASRFYELLDALKSEYEVSMSSAIDPNNRMNASEYESKVHQQVLEMKNMQKTLVDLERSFSKTKQEYEEDIARLKRAEDVAEDHLPLLPFHNVGLVAISNVYGAGSGAPPPALDKRSVSFEDAGRNVRPRESSSGAISDIAAAAAAASVSNAPLSSTYSSASSSSLDWLVTYNPKVPRSLSLDLAHSIQFEGVVCCVKYSHSGSLLAVSGNKLCVIYDTVSGRPLYSLPHTSSDDSDLYVRSLNFSPSDEFLATGSEDNSIRIWELKSSSPSSEQDCPKLLKTLTGHTQDVYALEFIDEEHLISGSGDRTLRLWAWRSGGCLCTQNISKPSSITSASDSSAIKEAGITSLALSNCHKYVVTGSLENLVRLYQLCLEAEEPESRLKLIDTFTGHMDSVYSVAFAPQDNFIISGSLDRSIRKWEFISQAPTSKCLQVLTGHKDFVLSVAATPQLIFSGSKDRTVQLWDPQSDSPLLTLQGHKNSVISVAIAPSGSSFATGSGDGRARIWKISEKRE